LSLVQLLRDSGKIVVASWQPRDPSPQTHRRVVVVEQAANGVWKFAEADITGDAVTVRRAQRVQAQDVDDFSEPAWARNHMQPVLIPEAQRSVCRLIDIADAPPDQMQRIIALRLELELPYPPAQSTWICEPQTNGDNHASRALLLAAATSEIATAERTLAAWGLRGPTIEFAPAGLAELALAADPSDGAIAVVALEGHDALLVMAHARALCYARHIRLPAGTHAPQDWAPQLAKEIKQSVYDYLLRTGNPAPESLGVTGAGVAEAGVLETVEQYLEMPVRALALPGAIRLADPAMREASLMADFPICLGVLIAMRRRMRGEPTAAPAFRRKARGLRAITWRTRAGALAGANLALLGLLVASFFGVQAVQLRADSRLLESSRPLLRGLEGLQEEVDILRYEERRARSMLDTLQALAEALPAEIQIESLAIDARNRLTFSGKANSVEAASDKAITALEKSPAFTKPRFNGATRDKEAFTFQITCELAAGGRGAAR
jgi:hypothetical protein